MGMSIVYYQTDHTLMTMNNNNTAANHGWATENHKQK
jgi:hypothetical protein